MQEIPKRFCMGCGAILNSEMINSYYDFNDGEMGYEISYVCPNRRKGWFSPHTKIIADENGEPQYSRGI